MRFQRVAMLGALGLVVAACVATAPSESEAPPSAAEPTATPTVSSLHGPRTFDWTSSRVTGRATRDVPPDELIAANAAVYPAFSGAPSTLVTTGAPVTASAAVYGTTWVEGSSPSASDMLFFGVNGTSSTSGINGGVYTSGGVATTAPSNNFFALTNLYAGTGSPALAWSVSLPGGLDRTGVTVSGDGTKVYALDTTGVLHCLVMSTGAACSTLGSGWSDFQANCAVHGSSPWVSYTTGDIYFADDCATVHRVNATTGAATWSLTPGYSTTYQAKFESSLVVVGGYVYVGDDEGQLFRITDATSTPTAIAVFDVCAAIGQAAPCPNGYNASPAGSGSGPWAIRAPIAFDTINNHAYIAANDYVFELNGGSGNWAQTASSPKHLQSGVDGVTNGPMLSAAILDSTNKFLYTALDGKLFKLSYPFSGPQTSGVYTSTLQSGSGTANPAVDVIPYNNAAYVGDNGGGAERFDCSVQTGANALDGLSTVVGSSVTASGVLDYSTGNTNFGVTTSTGGGLMQWPLSVTSYSCPSGQDRCTSTNGPANTCVPPTGSTGTAYGDACRGCCTSTDCSGSTPICATGGTCVASCSGGPGVPGNCPSLPNTSVTCSAATGGTCQYTCSSGYANCTGTIAVSGCTTVTSTDVNNCGGCGNACSTNNVPSPVCTAGVCNGHCADGYVDCDGNRLSNGCESSAACGVGGCCGNTCATGTTCYDNGGTGTCVNGQTTEASGSNSQNNVAALTCPAGQLITSIVFADYGTPDGVGGQSWSTLNSCGSHTTSSTCSGVSGCTWNGAQCVAYACWNITTSSACSTAGCTWLSATGTCTTSTCAALTSQSTCTSTSGCAWDTSASVCTASYGFLHDYGTSPNDTYPPNCALDVSADSVITTGCLYNVNSCSFTAKNDYLGTGTNPSSGATLPLSTTSPNPSGYPQDPCPNIYKRLYIQATCGYCENECTTGSQCGSGTCTNGRCLTPSCAPDCGTGAGCNVSSDCATGICTNNVCQAPACSGTCGEGSVCGSNADCGSGTCTNGHCVNATCTPICGNGVACGSNSDCASGSCVNAKCQTPSCSPTCGDGAECGSSSDCGTGTCTNGKCQPPSCAPACGTNVACGNNADCASGTCTSGKCTAASCSPACTTGQTCGSAADCGSGICTNGRCATPTCATSCADGAGCGANSDCGSESCVNGKCATPSCANTCAAGADCGANTDCLSGTCTNGRCSGGTASNGSGCTSNSQCLSGSCSGTTCVAPACSGSCTNGSDCTQNSDCATGTCSNGKCQSKSCAPSCNPGTACGANSDCTSGICTNRTCASPSCSGSCVNGATCGQNSDCATGTCTNGVCAAKSCAPSCNPGTACGANSDCTSGICTNKACASPSCSGSCVNGATCGQNSDCATGTCTDGLCTAKSCAPLCNPGTACGANGDCTSGICTNRACASPSCSGSCVNGATCGQNSDCATGTCTDGLCASKSCAPKCNDGTACGANGDCGSDVCSGGSCVSPLCSPKCVTGSPCGQNSDCASSSCNSNTDLCN